MTLKRINTLKIAIFSYGLFASSEAICSDLMEYKSIDLPGVHLAYLDTGGEGEVIVLVHALAGTSESWRYQIEPLKKAGYRVVAYDRRGWGKSVADPKSGPQPGVSSEDLDQLMQRLKVDQFHLVGIAGGSFVAADYAAQYSDKLTSLTLSASTLSLDEPGIDAFSEVITPPEIVWPSRWLEVGASYAGENAKGLAEWTEIHRTARQEGAPYQPLSSPNTFAKLTKIKTPTLILAAGGDQLAPPGLMRMWAPYVKSHEWAIIADAGHSVAWERPDEYNMLLINFIKKHGRIPSEEPVQR